jgi:hypothetical protein
LVFLAACGGNGSDNAPTGGGNNPPTVQETPQPTETPTPEQETEATEQEFSIGEAVATDWMEFTLTHFELGTYLGNVRGSGFLMPYGESSVALGPNPWGAREGRVYASIGFSFQNVGRTTIDRIRMGLGYSRDFKHMVTLDFNDGFVFEAGFPDDAFADAFSVGGESPSARILSDNPLEPLSPAIDVIGFFNVPIVVRDDVDAPLRLIVRLENSDGEFEYFAYRIR